MSSQKSKSPFVSDYDPENFRKRGYEIIDLLTDYLSGCVSEDNQRVLTSSSPQEIYEKWLAIFSDKAPIDFKQFMSQVLNDSNHLHHPRYVGHQVSAPLPEAVLSDTVSAMLNNSSVVYEMGPVATAMEHICVQWMAKKIGFDNKADGVLTSGGTLGNLTALLAARQAQADYNIWEEGVQSEKNLAVLVADQSHYSVRRAVQVMGLGERGAIAVAADANFRMDICDLKAKYEAAKSRGMSVFAVVACGCSTATGSFDDLSAIANFCLEHGLWLHVDAAHGGSTLLSSKYKHLLVGIERADSVVWDAHKMMMLPMLVTGVIFRNGHCSYETFSQKAAYILSRLSQDTWYDMGLRTMECSKDMMALKLFSSLRLKGEAFFGDYIDYIYDLTKWFADELQKADDFEIPVYPECNIICFRYTKKHGDLNVLTEQIRKKIGGGEGFYMVKTTLGGKIYLRCTIINPLTTKQDLLALMDQVRQAVQ